MQFAVGFTLGSAAPFLASTAGLVVVPLVFVASGALTVLSFACIWRRRPCTSEALAVPPAAP